MAFKQQKDEMGEDGDSKGMWLKEMKEYERMFNLTSNLRIIN